MENIRTLRGREAFSDCEMEIWNPEIINDLNKLFCENRSKEFFLRKTIQKHFPVQKRINL